MKNNHKKAKATSSGRLADPWQMHLPAGYTCPGELRAPQRALGSGHVCREGPGSQEEVGEVLSAEGWAGCWAGSGAAFSQNRTQSPPHGSTCSDSLLSCCLTSGHTGLAALPKMPSEHLLLSGLLCEPLLCPGSLSSSSSFARSVTHTVSASPSNPQVAFLDKPKENCTHPSFSILFFCLIYFFTAHHLFLTDVIL